MKRINKPRRRKERKVISPLVFKFCVEWQNLLDHGKRGVAEYRGIPSLRIRNTDDTD